MTSLIVCHLRQQPQDRELTQRRDEDLSIRHQRSGPLGREIQDVSRTARLVAVVQLIGEVVGVKSMELTWPPDTASHWVEIDSLNSPEYAIGVAVS